MEEKAKNRLWFTGSVGAIAGKQPKSDTRQPEAPARNRGSTRLRKIKEKRKKQEESGRVQ